MSTMDKIKKDLPFLINGFCVGLLTIGRPFGWFEIALLVIAGLTIVKVKNC